MEANMNFDNEVLAYFAKRNNAFIMQKPVK